MIGKLKGILDAKAPPQVLLDVSGVCYEVDVPLSSFFMLPEVGQPVVLLTHFVVREDAQQLFGFVTPAELAMFKRLIKISGVGPKMALGILSGLSAQELAQAIENEDAARLVKVPGIGKKTAERLILELRGKLVSALEKVVANAIAKSQAHSDIEQALVSLGYSEKDAAAAVKLLPADVGVSDGIKQAMKSLSR